ncbi:hypothetical protein DBR33_00125 [Stenotrophomonas sp. HMWF022]|nr:hypothetical protein DBR20_02625 [Stenotrophomonas sp. HMWF023]PTT58956.1 hypothetical protein DBR33_00125 [Stenotrophomonas sp. HMWF022]
MMNALVNSGSIALGLFDSASEKEVTATDRGKSAYVLSRGQVAVLTNAGRAPKHEDPFDVSILFDATITTAEATFYESERAPDASRKGELRLGREIVSQWMRVGDLVVIANIGERVFAFRKGDCPADPEQLAEVLAKSAPARIMARALGVAPSGNKKIVQRSVYERNPWVVAGALLRAGGKCEVEDCEVSLFLRDDGSPYLEVHHIEPLSDGGPDVLENVAAICPMCHRRLHHGSDRSAISKRLASGIRLKTATL